MKASHTMLSICTGAARKNGPRVDPLSGQFGYYLTVSEIKNVHYACGFSTRRTRTIPGNILGWTLAGHIECDDNVNVDEGAVDDDSAVWWPDLSDPNGETIEMAADRAYVSPDMIRIAGKPRTRPVTVATRAIETWGPKEGSA